jgi:hypothetical protein
MMPHRTLPCLLPATLGLVLLMGCSRGSGADGAEAPPPGTEAFAPTTTTPPEAAQAEPAAETPPTPSTNRPPITRQPVLSQDRDLAQRLGLAPPEPLRVSDLLTHADIRELVQYTGELAVATLDGLEPEPFYNHVRLSAGEGFGFSVQLWQPPEERQAAARFERLRDTYIDRQPDAASGGPADQAFLGEFEGIRHYAMLHRASRSAAVVSCQADLCSLEQIRLLAARIASRL